MFKTSILLLLSLVCSASSIAQQERQTTLGIEAGVAGLLDADKLGLFLHLEPRHSISENGTIGLRLGATLNTHTIINDNEFNFNIYDAGDNGVISFVPIFEYQLKRKKYRPYLGFGIGYYVSGNFVNVEPIPFVDESVEVSIDSQLGFLLRGGVRPRKTRFGIEYNYVPKSDIKLPNSEVVGVFDLSYFGVSIGLVIGR